MKQIETDLLVIGAGSGGLSVAAGAVQMGAKVVLLEGHEMGGDCLNFGCVPSKALIASGKTAYAMQNAHPFGIANATPVVDYAKAKDHVDDVIATIAPVDSQERFEALGCKVIRAFGRFTGPQKVVAGDTEITARRIVISTGSSPFVPPIEGLSDVPYLTNETLWELREQPEHLLVIGGGPIGLEMAQAHHRLGCKVTVIEAGKALSKDDPELAEMALDSLRAEGITILEGTAAQAVSEENGIITVKTNTGNGLSGSHILIAVGRRANMDKLDLDKAGIETTATGIKVDDSMKTTNSKVYAIGDVAGGLQFTHVAGYQAGIVIRSALFGLPAKAKTNHMPWATYIQPELAQVGLTEAQAKEQFGSKLEVARFDIHHNDRAIAERKTKGLIKVMVVRGKPVGASIFADQAGELIPIWSLAIANGLKMSNISAMIAPYPTVAEVNKRVAGAYFTPKLFESDRVKKIVGFVQRWLP